MKKTKGTPQATSRRRFLGQMTAGGVAAAVVPNLTVSAQDDGRQDGLPSIDDVAIGEARSRRAFRLRQQAARNYLRQRPPEVRDNGDERRYDDFRSCFFKALPQNDYGEVQSTAYRALLEACERGTVEAFDAVPLSAESDRRLANPLAAFAFEMIGPDSWSTRMPPAPTFASAAQAAEMAEVYWQALTRDVPFRDYADDTSIQAAIDDLNRFSEPAGGAVGLNTLFRGETPGDRVGPYISQLLWLPANWGLVALDQRFALPEAGQDFGTAQAEWLAIQRGVAPTTGTVFGPTPRHIATGRDLAEYVHNDVSYQAYLTAALVLFSFGEDALDPENPYLESEAQGGFVTFGGAQVVDLVAKAANAALKAAWFQKWLVHRRLRPEVFAARVHFQAAGERDYGIHPEMFDSAALSRLESANGSLLLPLSFPEGSPTHPSYPAGHAAVAGACCTMLKALFNEAYVIPEPVEASHDGFQLDPWSGEELTVGGEINKLANNISLGRDTAGVHYRTDGTDGVALGESVALGILQDYARTRAERFAGFGLTLFDGTAVQVSSDGITRSRGPGRRRQRRRRGLRENA